jgi:hypothetical protein
MVKMEVLGRAASTAPAVIPGRNGDLDVLRNYPGVPFAWRLQRRACRWLPTDHNPAGAISPSYVPASRGYLAGAAAVHEPFLFELRRRLHSRHVPPQATEAPTSRATTLPQRVVLLVDDLLGD